MLRRVDSRAKGELCWLWASVLALTQGALDVQQGQPGSARTCREEPPRMLVCLDRATFHARGHTLCSTRISLQIPETLAACGFFEASRLSLLETAPLRTAAGEG